jgi:hypothetical protein
MEERLPNADRKARTRPDSRRVVAIATRRSTAAVTVACLVTLFCLGVRPSILRAIEAETAGAAISRRTVKAGLLFSGASAQAQGLEPVSFLPLALVTCYLEPDWSGTARFGFASVCHPAEEYDIALLHADWYVQYPGFRTDHGPEDLEYAQIIRLNEYFEPPEEQAIVRYARAHPGTLWLIGNEPDAPAQDCIIPSEYAVLYHHFYTLLKGTDPQAKVAIGGVVQGTPLRLRYLDEILEEYQDLYNAKIPVDVWNVHGFILRERVDSWGCQIPCGLTATQGKLYGIDDHDNMTIFAEQIVRFRQWMKDNGERNKPLIVSEYGILLPEALGYDRGRVRHFMTATFDYFLSATSSSLGYREDGNRLVQAWNWYSLDHEDFEGYESWGHLFDPDTREITSLGTAYGNYVSSLP